MLTGLWVGWQRWRPGWFGQRRYGSGQVHPYRERWPRWHFWLGLTGGGWAMLCGFSAVFWPITLASVQPRQRQAGRAGALPRRRLAGCRAGLARAAGHAVGGAALAPPGRTRGVAGLPGRWPRQPSERIGAPQAASADRPAFSADELTRAALRLYPGAQVTQHNWLSEGDACYHPRPRGDDALDKPFPVLRLQLNDASASWLYLDPATGQLLKRVDRSRRAYRWLFNALHSWDVPVLRSRPLWDGWMIIASVLGIGLGVTSLVVGGKRLARSWRGDAFAEICAKPSQWQRDRHRHAISTR